MPYKRQEELQYRTQTKVQDVRQSSISTWGDVCARWVNLLITEHDSRSMFWMTKFISQDGRGIGIRSGALSIGQDRKSTETMEDRNARRLRVQRN